MLVACEVVASIRSGDYLKRSQNEARYIGLLLRGSFVFWFARHGLISSVKGRPGIWLLCFSSAISILISTLCMREYFFGLDSFLGFSDQYRGGDSPRKTGIAAGWDEIQTPTDLSDRLAGG